MNSKKLSFGLAALAIGLFLSSARLAKADTISVHDLSHNVATGVYTYTIQFDSNTDMRSNDGFVIYNFKDLTSWTLSGGVSTAQFTLSQTASSNTLNDSAAVDAFAGVAALTNGIPNSDLSINNLSFSYVGPPTDFTGAATAVLTLNTTLLNASTLGVYASVDHSGISQQSPFGNAEGPVTVPGSASVPLPHSFWGGSLMFALLAGSKLLKSRAMIA